jgi:hypothetical protein
LGMSGRNTVADHLGKEVGAKNPQHAANGSPD